MTKAEVFHTKEYSIFQRASWPDGYQKVAEIEFPVDTDLDRALNQCFKLTNHIDEHWWRNPGVTCFVRNRSTSPQDIVVIEGVPYLCCAVGWRPLSEASS